MSWLSCSKTNVIALSMAWWNNLKFNSKNPEVRRKAIESLQPPGDAQTVELLVAAFTDHDAEVRNAAAKAFEQIKDDTACQLIVTALYEGAIEARQAAATALGFLGDRQATNA